MDMNDLNWYPGHMTKARRAMQENMKIVDVVIELVDARIPLSGRNPDIDTLAASRPRILVMGKADLADPQQTKLFIRYFEQKGFTVLSCDLRQKKDLVKIGPCVVKAAEAKIQRAQRKGMLCPSIRAMVCGIPNVGKSTMINSLAGRSSARTGNKPGVTRGIQYIRVPLRLKTTGNAARRPGSTSGNGPVSLDILDTPGILWPKFDDPQVGIRLALTAAIREEILDEYDLSLRLLEVLQQLYPQLLAQRYGLGETILQADPVQLLDGIAAIRNYKKTGGGLDRTRCAHMLLDDFKNGRIGRITLDRLP